MLADEVNRLLILTKINGEPGLVLAVPRDSHILPGKFQSVLS